MEIQQKSKKTWFYDLWKQHGWNGTHEVRRVAFRYTREFLLRWELKQHTMCWTNCQSYGRIAQDMRMAEVMDCPIGGYGMWFLVQVAIGRDGWSMRRDRQSRTPFGREQMSREWGCLCGSANGR